MNKITVKMIKEVTSDTYILNWQEKDNNEKIRAKKGDIYDAMSNPYGAIFAIMKNGKTLGIKPGEFEFIEAPEWVLEKHRSIKQKKSYKVEAQALITLDIEAESPEEAEIIMSERIDEEFETSEIDWCISAHDVK